MHASTIAFAKKEINTTDDETSFKLHSMGDVLTYYGDVLMYWVDDDLYACGSYHPGASEFMNDILDALGAPKGTFLHIWANRKNNVVYKCRVLGLHEVVHVTGIDGPISS